jgi:multiple sugar transport system substrate-binding protein
MLKPHRLAASLVAAAVIAACGSGPSTAGAPAAGNPNEKVTLSFWDTNAGPTRTPYWQELIKRFEAANPNITVDYVGIPIAQQQQKLQTAVQAGSPPDVSNPGSNFIASLVTLNGLLPLDGQFNAWPERADIPPSIVSALKGLVPDKKLYGVPLSTNITILYYRKDLVTRANLPQPTTWTDFYNDVNALTDPAHGMYGFGLRGATGSLPQLESWVVSQAGLTSYFDKSGKSTFDSPAAVAAIQKIVSLYGRQTPKDDINHGYPEMVSEFDGGHVAMIMHNLGSYPQHVQAFGKDNLGAVVLPALSSGRRDLTGGASNAIVATVFRGTKHPVEAWKFAAFLASADSVSYFNQSIGQMPPNNKVSGAQWVKDNTAIQNALAAQADRNTTLVAPPIQLPDYASIETQEEPNFQKVLLGQMTAQDFATDFAGKMTTSLQKYSQAHR